jgi:hypothetical protein
MTKYMVFSLAISAFIFGRLADYLEELLEIYKSTNLLLIELFMGLIFTVIGLAVLFRIIKPTLNSNYRIQSNSYALLLGFSGICGMGATWTMGALMRLFFIKFLP